MEVHIADSVSHSKIPKWNTDIEIRLVFAKGEEGRERDGLGVWGW